MACSTDLELRRILAEASQSLTKLDARRLEEIALSCQAQVRNAFDSDEWNGMTTKGFAEVGRGLLAFGRMLEATRANLAILRRLRDRDTAELDYGLLSGVSTTEVPCGDH
jgi:hypothetical protein